MILYFRYDLRIPSAAMLIQAVLAPFLDYKDDLSLGYPNSKWMWDLTSILRTISVEEHNSSPAYWTPPRTHPPKKIICHTIKVFRLPF